MGTTLVMAVVEDGVMYVANIGDSRLYVVNNTIRQITMDHSLVEELIRNGQLERDKGRNHPEKNIITRALGIDNKVVPDFFEIELTSDDKVLLCSDGLSNMIEDDEIQDIVSEDTDLTAIGRKLIERANYYGGKDNISAVVVAVDWED
jgi:protein phosphatase